MNPLLPLGAVLLLAADPPAAKTDAAGDPLPAGAVARLGTVRMRDPGGWSPVTLAPDGKHLLALPDREGGLVRLDPATGRPADPKGPKPTSVFGGRLDVSADGSRGVVTSYNGQFVFDAKTGRVLLKTDRRLPYGDWPVSLSADGKVFAAGGSKDEKEKSVTAVVWDVDKKAKRAEVAVLQNQSASVLLSPDGRLLATWGSHYAPTPPGGKSEPAEPDPGKVIQFWDTATGKEVAKAQVQGFGMTSMAFAPDGRAVAVASSGGGVRLIDPKTGAETRQLFGRSDAGASLTFSPDGKVLAVGGFDGAVQFWDLAGAGSKVVECPAGPLPSGGARVRLTGADTGTAWATVRSAMVVWELPSGKLLSPAGGHVSGVESIAFAGKEILTGGDGTIYRWDPATGKQLGEVRLRTPGRDYGGFAAYPVKLHPGGRTALAARGGNEQAVFDAATGTQLVSFPSGMTFGAHPVLCADGATLLVSPPEPDATKAKEKPKAGKTTPVWDITTGRKLAELEAPAGYLYAAAVTPDRSKVVTLIGVRSADGLKTSPVLTGWELATGKKLGEHSWPTGGGGYHLVPAPDNATAVVGLGQPRLSVVDFVAGKAVREIDTAGQTPTAVSAFSPDGKRFAVGTGYPSGPPPTVRLYDAESGKQVKAYTGHAAAVMSFAFAPDGKTLASGSTDTTVLVWDLSAPGAKDE